MYGALRVSVNKDYYTGDYEDSLKDVGYMMSGGSEFIQINAASAPLSVNENIKLTSLEKVYMYLKSIETVKYMRLQHHLVKKEN
ncbi:hypothetical protein LOS20_16135 [Enterococcus faecium]|nr:hypothetical protein [Enterococcus faecium]